MSSTLIKQQKPILKTVKTGFVKKVYIRLSQVADYIMSAERVTRNAGIISSRGNFVGGSLLTVDAKSRVGEGEVQ